MGLLSLISGKPSQDRFAAMVMKEFAAEGVTSLVYDAQSFRLLDKNDEGRVLNLANAYADYCERNGAARKEVIPRFVRAFMSVPDTPETFEEVKPLLIPRVRELGFLESMKLQVMLHYGEDAKHFPVGRTYAESFTLSLGVDHPDAISMVSEAMIADWGVTLDEALEVAKENLWSRSIENFKELAPGLYVSPWQDDVDTSRLFLPELINQVEVKGRHVAAAPNRSNLFVTGSEDDQGLAMLSKLTSKIIEDEPHRQVSAAPLILNGDEWEPYLPPSDHDLFEEYRRLHIQTVATEYQGQKELLDTYHEKQGIDVFVASVMVAARKQSDEWTTHAVWGKGIDSLLPRVESVLFVEDGAEPVGPVPWDDVLEVVGELMGESDHLPLRWRVNQYPSPEQLERLAQAVVLE